ncbi:hypothetical protein [Cellulosilyticum sp. I15G10I2]|uniref:hypothetical protein n=1 Tax=Cellulosilyticum sp. I15G10I2 TaxID=1892843 RepID=UPI00085C51E0|nr:hypothetical protein [Cellulosilyticum sp. I15G10I2]
MYLIRQVFNPIENLDDMYIYESIDELWQLNQIIKVRDSRSLAKLLGYSTIYFDYAIIKFNRIYRNTFYYLYPRIKVIIDKKDVVDVFKSITNPQDEAYEEAAAIVETQADKQCSKEVLDYFIYHFYTMTSKQDAIKHYELWQTYVPLNDKKIGSFVSLMEIYLDEITNYFDKPQTML